MNVAVAQTKSDQSGVYEREDLLNGCQAVAHGVRLADVDVIAAYPIRQIGALATHFRFPG